MMVRAWHGGQHENPCWFTSDRDHAMMFGEVRLYEITASKVIELFEEDIDAIVGGLSGYEADAAMYAYMDETDADLVILHGWEGSSICYLANPRWTTIREVDE